MNFIDPLHLPLTTLDKIFNPYLIVLSILIAILASFTAFGTSERIQACSNRLQKNLWILFGAISMGIGYWSMHFIGSLALELSYPVSYNLNLTLLSIIPAILASGVILWLMNQSVVSLKKLLFCCLLLAASFSAMHYMGMSAMQLSAKMLYLKSIFVAALLLAFSLSIFALKITTEVIRDNKNQFIKTRQNLGAVVMGVIVSSIHYTAMQAIVFIPIKDLNKLEPGINTTFLSIIVCIVVLLVLIVALIVPYMHRFRQMAHTLQENAEKLIIAATAFQTQEGIMVANKNKHIIRINNAFTKITGYSEKEVLGKDPRFLKSGKHNALFYQKYWDTINKEGKWSGEIWNKRKNGEVYPEWQTISSVKDENGMVTHYVSFISDITDFKSAEKEIETLAFYDPLTSLPNRRLFKERLEHELNSAKRYYRAGILFFMDLDRFKQINDSLGHAVGDKLLIETAKRLKSLLRDSDTAVRLGGDEFIILTSAQDGIQSAILEQSRIIAEKIIGVINSPFVIDNHELIISTSIGITLFTGNDETVEILLKRADTAMYQAKADGRNTFCFYQQSMQDAVDKRNQIEKNLRLAISKKELSIHYQPQFSQSNKIIGVEALLRWHNSDLGLVEPIEFIPIAEESGLIIPIGHWLINSVCEQLNSWSKQSIHIPHIAINISAKQFLHADFVSMCDHTTFEHQINPGRLVLEITESVFLSKLEEVVDKMNTMKENGFSFSIDDFGTGYSSLTYLKRLPFDQLKIDQAFIHDMVDQPRDVAIVKAIIVMAKGLNLNLIAEGVETDQHLAYLSSFGCHNYQGYYFSKPLPADQLSKFFKDHERKGGMV